MVPSRKRFPEHSAAFLARRNKILAQRHCFAGVGRRIVPIEMVRPQLAGAFWPSPAGEVAFRFCLERMRGLSAFLLTGLLCALSSGLSGTTAASILVSDCRNASDWNGGSLTATVVRESAPSSLFWNYTSATRLRFTALPVPFNLTQKPRFQFWLYLNKPTTNGIVLYFGSQNGSSSGIDYYCAPLISPTQNCNFARDCNVSIVSVGSYCDHIELVRLETNHHPCCFLEHCKVPFGP